MTTEEKIIMVSCLINDHETCLATCPKMDVDGNFEEAFKDWAKDMPDEDFKELQRFTVHLEESVMYLDKYLARQMRDFMTDICDARMEVIS
jgi:hypothetical protein